MPRIKCVLIVAGLIVAGVSGFAHDSDTNALDIPAPIERAHDNLHSLIDQSAATAVQKTLLHSAISDLADMVVDEGCFDRAPQ